MGVQTVAHEIRLQKWSSIVKECRSSGKPIKDWCAENNINLKTYYYWQKLVCQDTCKEISLTSAQKLKQDLKPVQVNRDVVFAELSLTKPHAGKVALTIDRRDMQIHIYCGADRATVESTLLALKGLC